MSDTDTSPKCTQCHLHAPRPERKLCQICTDRLKRRTLRLKAKKLCTACGKPARPNRNSCEECAERRKIKTSGVPNLCSSCTQNVPRPGLLTCEICAEKGRLSYKTRLARGVCAKCPKPVVKGYSYCTECREKQREHNRLIDEEVVLSGKCVKHPDRDVAENNRRFCPECAEVAAKRARAKRAERNAARRCQWCNKKLKGDGVLCEKHKQSAKEYRRMGKALETLRSAEVV